MRLLVGLIPHDDLVVIVLRDNKETKEMQKRFETTINLAWREKESRYH